MSDALPKRRITLTVNGKEHSAITEDRYSLADFLRHGLGLTGTHLGCEHGVCGACTVLVDGQAVRGCLMLAVLWAFISAIRAQINRKTALMRGIAFSATMAIIALAIHSTVDFNLQIPANAATFVVILALGQISLYQKSRRS